jgi:hypothetical protein
LRTDLLDLFVHQGIAVNSAFLRAKVNGRVHLFRTGRAVVARKLV